MLEPLQRLGDFKIIRLLGKGGMGEVYEAQQSNPERRVALKILAPWLAKNDDALERFWREAKVPAQLDHPGVVRIISTGKCGDIAYYAMQLVRGISLADLMRKANDPLPETLPQPTTDHSVQHDHSTPAFVPRPSTDNPPAPDFDSPPPIVQEYLADRFTAVARIGVQAARALAAAHRHGVLHRDVKPSNLMVDHHNQLYIMDFGLTRALGGDSQLTGMGILVGTPWYMSPEQARGEPIDARSDLFSLGVTLYQLASGGSGPYTANKDDSNAVLQQVRVAALKPIMKSAPNIPPRLGEIIMKAVEGNIHARYQTAQELAEDLEVYLGIPQSGKPRSASAIAPSRKQRWRTLAGVGVLGVVVLLAMLLLNRPRQTEEEVILEAFAKRERPLRVRVPLFRDDNQPVLKPLRLLGAGAYFPMSKELVVTSPHDGMPTLLALDDLTNHWFEFSVDVRQAGIAIPEANDLGLFYGWKAKKTDPMARWRFFVVQLDRRPVLKDTHGRARIGTALIEKAEGAKGGFRDFFRPLKGPKSWIPLAPPDPKQADWHTLRVKVLDNGINVSVDNEPAQQFDVNWMVTNDGSLAPFSLEPRGLVGIWVRNGMGQFRNATIMTYGPADAR